MPPRLAYLKSWHNNIYIESEQNPKPKGLTPGDVKLYVALLD